LFPDLPLEAALRFVQDAPLVPVVNRANFRQVEGVITREDVFRRYREEESE
jgi:CBS domain-containing protein